jgi:uncharacterized protein (TIGR00369 family)
MFGLSGADQLRAMLAGHTQRPPLSRLTGLRLTEVGDGSATFELPLTDWLCVPQGAISIGPLTMPADGAMACAIQTTLPAATPFTTSELSLRLLAPVRPGSTLVARGRLIQARRTIALADASITDEQGRLIAHGSTLCFLLPRMDPAPEPPELPPHAEPRAEPETPDPWRRPALGETLAQSVFDRMSGLAVLQATLAGDLPRPPISHLIGIRLTAASENAATFQMPATEWLCAPPRGRVQGGAVALLAESALSAAIQTSLPAGTALAPVDLKVNYLRPLASDGRPAVAQGQLVHLGRRIAVANAMVNDADGKPVAVATGSAIVLAGRPASLGTERPASLPDADQ